MEYTEGVFPLSPTSFGDFRHPSSSNSNSFTHSHPAPLVSSSPPAQPSFQHPYAPHASSSLVPSNSGSGTHPTSMFGNNNLIMGGNFNQFNTSRRPAFDILQEFVSRGACHNSFSSSDAPKCHPNTRVAVIDKITNWVAGTGDEDAFMLWLYGSAGAGKSAIGHSVALACAEWGRMLASFFFFRTDPRRNSGKWLAATLAYQITTIIPPFRLLLELAIELHPLIFQDSVEAQLMKLIVEPLQHLAREGLFSPTPMPHLVLIDGLDECEDHAMQRQIVEAIAAIHGRTNLPLKFLLASRAESQLIAIFNAEWPFRIHRLMLDNDDGDIRSFLCDEFYRIRNNHRYKLHIPPNWPGEGIMQELVWKSSGQFIYASVVVRFVDSPRHLPTERLDIIRGLRPSEQQPFAKLDALYCGIFDSVEKTNIQTVLQVLGTLHVRRDLFQGTSAPSIADLYSLQPREVETLFADLTPIISCDPKGNVELLHKSLSDFLCDPARSRGYFVDLTLAYTHMACWILRTWNSGKNGDLKFPLHHLITCCREALLTDELRSNLLAIQPATVNVRWPSKLSASAYPQPPAYYCFLMTLEDKCSSLPAWDEVYQHCRVVYDHQLLQSLKTTSWHPLLIYILKKIVPTRRAISAISRIIPLAASFCEEMQYILRAHPISFCSFLSAFFRDPSRAQGCSKLTGQQSAKAAICLLKRVASAHQNQTSILLDEIASWASHSKYSPWLSRKVRQKRVQGVIRRFLYTAVPDGGWGLDDPALNNTLVHEMGRDHKTYRLALHLLPKLLTRAARSEEILSYIPLRCSFNLDFFLCSSRVARLRGALNAYATRVNGVVNADVAHARQAIMGPRRQLYGLYGRLIMKRRYEDIPVHIYRRIDDTPKRKSPLSSGG